MKLEQFLRHHGITGNPFSEEDAQTDTVFKRRCLATIHHPAWNKFFGSPADPSTALVFGEKGSGKTALRLQADAELESYNQANPQRARLRRFRTTISTPTSTIAGRRCARRTWTQVLENVAASRPHGRHPVAGRDEAGRPADGGEGRPHGPQPRPAARPACSWPRSTTPRRASRSRVAGAGCAADRASARSGPAATCRSASARRLVVIALIALFPGLTRLSILPWLLVPILAGWLYWGWRLARAEWFARDIRKGLRVLSRDPSALRWELLWFKPTELGGQPLPTASRGGAEERYELLRKFQGVLHTLGYAGIVVLIDRVDEPQQVEGDPRKMRALIWPLLDHKFLRHPGIGVKLLLPIELAYYLEKENKEFYDRARPDKLNMIKPLRWTGPSLYDLASDRLRACRPDPSANGEAPRLRRFIDDAISDDYLKDALGNLRTPRHLFKFLHRLIEEHCHRHTEDAPRWTIDYDTFRTTYAAYMRDLEAFDRGYGHG